MPKDAAPWLVAAGVFNLALAAFHLLFWRLFDWPKSIAQSGMINRGVTQILNLAVTYFFVVFSVVCFLFPAELVSTALGNFLLLAMAAFWIARALLQPLFFGLRHFLSIALFGVFIAGAIIHAAAWAMRA